MCWSGKCVWPDYEETPPGAHLGHCIAILFFYNSRTGLPQAYFCLSVFHNFVSTLLSANWTIPIGLQSCHSLPPSQKTQPRCKQFEKTIVQFSTPHSFFPIVRKSRSQSAHKKTFLILSGPPTELTTVQNLLPQSLPSYTP